MSEATPLEFVEFINFLFDRCIARIFLDEVRKFERESEECVPLSRKGFRRILTYEPDKYIRYAFNWYNSKMGRKFWHKEHKAWMNRLEAIKQWESIII